MDWDWISGFVGAGVMGAAWFARHAMESVQRAKEAFQAERFNTYVSILEPLMQGVKGMKRKGAVHEIRRDLGNRATNLTDLDMMRVLVQDIGAYSRT